MSEKFICFRYGTTRTVLLIWKYAVKIPAFVSWKHFLLGLVGNIRESERYQYFPSLPFAPVLFSFPGGFLNIMPRCQEILYDIEAEFDLDGYISCHHLNVEPKLDSFGILNGKLVAVDYGD